MDPLGPIFPPPSQAQHAAHVPSLVSPAAALPLHPSKVLTVVVLQYARSGLGLWFLKLYLPACNLICHVSFHLH